MTQPLVYAPDFSVEAHSLINMISGLVLGAAILAHGGNLGKFSFDSQFFPMSNRQN